MVLLDDKLRMQLVNAFTEDNKLHVDVSVSSLVFLFLFFFFFLLCSMQWHITLGSADPVKLLGLRSEVLTMCTVCVYMVVSRQATLSECTCFVCAPCKPGARPGFLSQGSCHMGSVTDADSSLCLLKLYSSRSG